MTQRKKPELTTIPTSAGGFPAIRSSFEHMRKHGHGVASALKILSSMNQKDGFDCPGCAWPDPDDRRSTIAEFCENGAKAAAWEATTKKIDETFFVSHSVQELSQQSDRWLGDQGRFVEPLVLRPGSTHYESIEWNEAFALIAKELNALDSPNEAIFYTSGRTSNEAAFLYQLFVRAFGTNNLPDCSNMCHESSGVGLSETVGIGKGSVTLEDIHTADTIVVMGQNPGTNHPRMLTALQKAKRGGAKIIAINPLPEVGLMSFTHPQSPVQMLTGGTRLTDLFLQVRVGGDIALLKALMVLMLQAERAKEAAVFDHEFITEHTEGYESLVADLDRHNLSDLCKECGLPESEVRAAAKILLEKPNTIICWAMGLTQHVHGVANVREVVNLLLLRGSIGKPGAGTCPVRGHSNVQGDRTMGIHERPSPNLITKISEVFGFEAPTENGFNTVAAIEAMRDRRASVFISMGGNFLSATPDTEVTARALGNCNLTVQVSTKLNRSHLTHGRTSIILPCLVRSERDVQSDGEQFVSVENSMGVVHSSIGKREPASDKLMSESSIVAHLANATLSGDLNIDWLNLIDNYDRIRDLIEEVIPGFESYNKRVRVPGGFHLYNSARERKFTTPNGKAKFTINDLPDLSIPEGKFRMTTVRSHDQYNTTIYGDDDRYRGIKNGRRVVFMNEADMADHNLSPEQKVDLKNTFGGASRIAEDFSVVPYSIPRGCVATYFPEANVLVPLEKKAIGSHTPASKDVIVVIEPRA